MKRLLKRLGIGLVVMFLIAAGVVYVLGQKLLEQRYSFPVRVPLVPTDPAAIQRGEHLVLAVLDCRGCHADDHGGRWVMNNFAMGRIGGGNLTTGRGSIISSYSDEDWVRAIRHGVGRDGRALLFMSSDAYAAISDRDLGDSIAYLKSLPPVDRALPRSSAGPIGRLLFLIGALPLPGAKLDHQQVEQASTPTVGPTAEYGKYLAVTSGCYSCHGDQLGGRPLGPSVRSANITPAAIGSWSEQDFTRALRQGVAPGERKLDPMMPSERAFSKLNDVEMKALWLWSRAIPPVPVKK